MASWEVDVNGKKHTIEWRPKRKNNVIIDGEPLTIKTNNPLVGGIDYEFKIEDTVFNLAGIGKIVRLAVNGTYLDTNEPYEPLGNLPTWITVLGIVSPILGLFIIGLLGLLIGLASTFLCGILGIKKKYGAVIVSFVGVTIIQLVTMFGIATFLIK